MSASLVRTEAEEGPAAWLSELGLGRGNRVDIHSLFQLRANASLDAAITLGRLRLLVPARDRKPKGTAALERHYLVASVLGKNSTSVASTGRGRPRNRDVPGAFPRHLLDERLSVSRAPPSHENKYRKDAARLKVGECRWRKIWRSTARFGFAPSLSWVVSIVPITTPSRIAPHQRQQLTFYPSGFAFTST